MKKQSSISKTFCGKVVSGNQIGRTIGFPTANLSIDSSTPFLEKGVYGVKVKYRDQDYYGIMNAGNRPTINKENLHLHYEVHVFDFCEEIYGQELTVETCFFVRKEMSFQSLEKLVRQINRDVQYTKWKFSIKHDIENIFWG
ncbi:riboflavin kinase [Domibacillus indicus]|uniref:riboflavin kinase n=1 Tax=Domibacillus indicus TaxID=1437523 RepID=UPI00203B5600|nr:riboflavin kinase [Domibacillus indicus]MCM3791041.1 riboflavin kinase [Domibacillus indicus]